MVDTRDLLVEIGTEEMPPMALRKLSESFRDGLCSNMEKEGISFGEATVYATPRRLAVLINDVLETQPEKQIEKRGPSLDAAFDVEGKPTKAAEGFSKSCGIPVEHLEHLETDEGSWLVFQTTEMGQQTQYLIPGLVEQALNSLPIPKRMRWSNLDIEFVRPVHWVVLLFGSEAIEAEVMGVTAGQMTRGHRFHHPGELKIDAPKNYATLLYSQGRVVADFDTRKQDIHIHVNDSANKVKGKAVVHDDLLEEVAALVEWPSAIIGSFEERYLDLPSEVLIETMKKNQKYFHIVDKKGKLMPNFIVVTNIDSSNPDAVRAGNERVIRPRLSDAAFFYQNDLQHPLEEKLEDLKQVVFQEKLGSLNDKSQRISTLASHIAIAMGLMPDDVKLAKRAGQLSKCDLLTEMVGEFPELQGVMGRYYASRYGEEEAVAIALDEQYKPRFAGDKIPESPIGRGLAIADKLDSLMGIFGIGQAPTGDKDPFALRRAALGTLRIIIEGEIHLDLKRLIKDAANNHGNKINKDDTVEQVFTFMMDRLRGYYQDIGITGDIFESVLVLNPTDLIDLDKRVRAVADFNKLPEAESLAAANKRIRNILKQAEGPLPDELDDTLFSEDAEWNLAAQLVGLKASVTPMISAGNYTGALTHLAGPTTMVMVPGLLIKLLRGQNVPALWATGTIG